MASDATQSARPIITLPTDVVQKIAAGEVVVRPQNAVKELIENSIDAGATEITVTCKNGGLDLIKVKDNGSGINMNDYERVCERFATSKLKTVADLQHISTFGFRGEALASISCMAKVQITSRTKDSPHAWTARYKNCKPLATPSPSAGLIGTQIVAENLFEDYPQRRSVFSRPNEETTNIANILIKYAINFPHIKFALVRDDGAKRSGGSFCSFGNGDQHAVIRLLMPSNLVRDLFDFEVSSEKYKFSAKICIANPLSSHTSTAIKAKNDKQKIFQLFINNRLVTSNKLKQTVDNAFSTHDAYCPFIHINMQIEPSRIDVNVHPTKEMVCFLDEAQIVDCIETKLFELLDTFRQRGIIEVKQSGRASTSRDALNTTRSSASSYQAPSTSSTSVAKNAPSNAQKPFVLYQTPPVGNDLDVKAESITPQKPTVLHTNSTSAFEISPIKGNRSSFDFGQKRKLNLSDDSHNNKSDVKPKVSKKKPDDNIYNSGSKYQFKTPQKYAQPSGTVRVDSTNRSIREFMTPNTSLLDVTYQSLQPGEQSVYSEHNVSLLSGERSVYNRTIDDSLQPDERSIYNKTVDDSFQPEEQTVYNESVDDSLPPGERSVYNETVDESLVATELETEYSDFLNKTVGELPDDRGKYVFKALAEAQTESSIYLTSIVRKFVFVGYVDITHAIFQSDTSIFVVDLIPLLEELFYQRCLRSVGRQNGRRIILCTQDFPDGMPMLSLVDTYLAVCPSAQLPNENKFDSKEDAAEDLMQKFCEPEVIKILWDFGISVVVDNQRGPLLNAIVSQADTYELLLSQQLAQFGYELACIDWEQPELLGKQIARAVARLHTPHQITNCSEEEAKQQCDMIKDRLVPLLKTDFFAPEKLKPHFRKLLSTVDAYKIFGRC